MPKSPPAGALSGWARWFGLYLGRIEGKAPGLEGPDDPEQPLGDVAPRDQRGLAFPQLPLVDLGEPRLVEADHHRGLHHRLA